MRGYQLCTVVVVLISCSFTAYATIGEELTSCESTLMLQVKARQLLVARIQVEVAAELHAGFEIDVTVNKIGHHDFYIGENGERRMVNKVRLDKIKKIYFRREGRSISREEMSTYSLLMAYLPKDNSQVKNEDNFISSQKKAWPELYLAILEYLFQEEMRISRLDQSVH